MLRKREGFKGQKTIVLPPFIQEELRSNPITRLLYVTDIGFYPAALYHYRDRPSGSEQNILIYCIDGKGWIEINGTKRKVCREQFVIIPAHKPHKYGSEESDPWTIYWAHFKGELSAKFLTMNFQVIDIESEENTRNDSRVRLFEETYETLIMGFSVENLEYSSVCLFYLLGSFQYITHFERTRSINKNDIIEKSILHMHNNLYKRISLNELAKYCGLSVSQFSLVFKKKTSRSPIEYYNNLKIQNACQLLDFTNMSIKEISSQLDFEDQFYFSRTFKKAMGHSPLEYRKRRKG
jgi:AraC family transcriptional regulator of arabinose operon